MSHGSIDRVIATCNWLMVGAAVMGVAYGIAPMFSDGPMPQPYPEVLASEPLASTTTTTTTTTTTAAAEAAVIGERSNTASNPTPTALQGSDPTAAAVQIEEPVSVKPDPLVRGPSDGSRNERVVPGNPIPIPLLNPDIIPPGLGECF